MALINFLFAFSMHMHLRILLLLENVLSHYLCKEINNLRYKSYGFFFFFYIVCQFFQNLHFLATLPVSFCIECQEYVILTWLWVYCNKFTTVNPISLKILTIYLDIFLHKTLYQMYRWSLLIVKRFVFSGYIVKSSKNWYFSESVFDFHQLETK